ncbi:hypothetical protein [Leptolyngbya subtilissima]|uniref:hypothetical protein n=1 Tax=Leptolyngbya subtilissima TaxID=1346803 RepID=UPI003298F6F6
MVGILGGGGLCITSEAMSHLSAMGIIGGDRTKFGRFCLRGRLVGGGSGGALLRECTLLNKKSGLWAKFDLSYDRIGKRWAMPTLQVDTQAEHEHQPREAIAP